MWHWYVAVERFKAEKPERIEGKVSARVVNALIPESEKG